MPVRWNEIEIPLSGVDQFTDAPHVLVNQLRDAFNVRFWEPPKAGKRYGFAKNALSSDLNSFPITRASRVHALEKQTVLCGDSIMYAQSEKNFKMADRGRLSELLVERKSVHHDQAFDRKDADLAYNQGILVVAWPAGPGEVGAIIINTATEAVIQTITWGTVGGINPVWVRCIALGNYICIFGDFTNGTPAVFGNQIGVLRIDVTAGGQYINPVGPSPTFLAVTSNQSTMPDVTPISATEYVIAYREQASGKFSVIRCDVATHTVQATFLSAASASCTSVAVEGLSGENVYSAYEDANSLKVVVHNAVTLAGSTTTADSSTPPRIGLARIDATTRLVTWELQAVGTVDPQLKYRTVNSAGSFGTAVLLPDLIPTSKPFYRDGRIYQWVAFDEPEQPTFYLAELTDDSKFAQSARWVGTLARGIAKEAQQNGFLHAVWPVDTSFTKYESAITCNYRVRFADKNDKTISIARAGVYRLKMDFGAETRHEAAQWGRSLVFAGARPGIFDGKDVGEVGFAWYPPTARMDTPTFGAISSGHLVNGVRYAFCFVFEWEDALGQIHRSAPSAILKHTVAQAGSANTIKVTQRNRLWTTHGQFGVPWGAATNVRIIPYRTVGAVPPAEPTGNFYRDSTIGFDATFGADVLIGQLFDDTNLILQDVLYITGDILDNGGVPPCSLVTYHGDRMWLGGCEEPEWLSFSQPFVDGEAPRFNEALRVLVGRPVRAMASMDGQIICWTDTEIYAVVGDGPPATGGLEVGYRVALVSSETGCSEPRSIALTKDGLGFMGNKGYCLLNRGLAIEWIGLPAKNYFDAYNLITSAVVTPDGRFLRISAKRGDGVSVWHVFDLTTKQWMIDATVNLGTIVDGAVAWDAARSAWGYAVASSDGSLHWEKPGTYMDNGNSGPITWQIVTAWINRASLGAGGPLQGWQFIKTAMLLGDFSDCYAFQVDVGYDYDNAYATTYTFTAADIAALERSQVSIDFEFMTCEAFRLRITELFQGGEFPPAHAGPQIRSIVIEAGFQRGPYRIQDAAAH